jgi:hypothetical protein
MLPWSCEINKLPLVRPATQALKFMPSSDVKTMDSTLSESKRYSGLIANFAASRKIKV